MNRIQLRRTLVVAAALGFAAPLFSTAAQAGECPADKVGVDVTKPGATAPKDVTDDVIAAIDLGQGYGVDGRLMRMRRLVVQPGGVVPWHSHTARPANIYIVEGSMTEYRSTCAVPIEHKAGDVTAEHGSLSHWWKNNGNKPAVLISADIVPAPMKNEGGM
ncbi:MAG: cupin domain-containing protein [Alphaproteobacteria bacterium]|nr:cupin domain-containing protein [Alphaproteobacteria bacterium]